jgi:hypothetical protein
VTEIHIVYIKYFLTNVRSRLMFRLLTSGTLSCENKTQTCALIDMIAELTILCSECGAMNTVNVDPSTRVQTAFCKECGAELHLVLARALHHLLHSVRIIC